MTFANFTEGDNGGNGIVGHAKVVYVEIEVMQFSSILQAMSPPPQVPANLTHRGSSVRF